MAVGAFPGVKKDTGEKFSPRALELQEHYMCVVWSQDVTSFPHSAFSTDYTAVPITETAKSVNPRSISFTNDYID